MSQPSRQPSEWRLIDQGYAVNTWRYLRVAMVVIVLGLAVSIAYERWSVHPGCFQPSISAYYYTPARGYLVGALVGMAVCLVCLRGNTPAEDILLNLAGMFAPVVAFVPTPEAGTCMSVPFAMEDRAANIANNVTALLAVGALSLVIVAIMAVRERPTTRIAVVASGALGVVWLAALMVFELARDFFDHNAHYAAAIPMFICIVAVVAINAAEYKKHKSGSAIRNPYTAVAVGMVVALVVIGGAGLLGWHHWTIAIETALLVLFAVFWTVQTIELWKPGLRVRTP